MKSKSLLLVLWVVLTAVNINKAFHIDDGFHLEFATYLVEHPDKPMSAMINWSDNPTDLKHSNQPPFFFFLIALVGSVFGFTEIPLHLMLSGFTFLALYFFSKNLEELKVNQSSLILTLFAFCPALMVNQNLMIDVPLLSLLLGTLYFLIKGSKSRLFFDYVMAALLASIAILFKYSATPILGILILVPLLRKDFIKLLVIFIPIGVLSIWGAWNYWEYGSIHFLDRGGQSPDFNSSTFVSFFQCIGAIGTFLISILYGSFPKKIVKYLILTYLLAFAVLVVMFYMDIVTESITDQMLIYLFLGNGVLLYLSVFRYMLVLLIRDFLTFLRSDLAIVLLFLGVFSSFVMLFAPFMATRHVLLVIPFLLLFVHKLFDISSTLMNGCTLITTVFLGTVLSISDWYYADFYREKAKNLTINTENTIWSRGHWGWHWYAIQEGMKTYASNESKIYKGDYFVNPSNIPNQMFNVQIHTEPIDTIIENAPLITIFSGKKYASMYNSFPDRPPWNLSKSPIDTINVKKVTKGINIDDIIEGIRSSEEWMVEIRKKAAEKNIPVDSMLVLDAQWLLNLK